MRPTFGERLEQAWQWLTLDGHIQLAQPIALLPGPLALLIGFVTPYRWIFFVGYCYLLLVLAVYVWVRALGSGITLRRHLDADWAQVGDILEESWELDNRSWLPLLWLEIDDSSTLPGYAARRVAAAGSYTNERWRTSARCQQRGVYQLGPLRARFADPFGLLRYEWHDSHIRAIVIYPPLVRLPFAAAPQGQRGGLARADLLQQHATPSVGGLREYVRGDAPSRIHWPTVARTNRLMIKEFDQDRAGALWIVLDLYREAYSEGKPAADVVAQAAGEKYIQRSAVETDGSETQFATPADLAIVLACSLAAAALGEGRTVGLIADDGQRRLILPGRGQNQLWRILSALVDANASGATPLGDLIQQSADARLGGQTSGALAVVTAALEAAWLPALVARQRGRLNGGMALLIAEDLALTRPLAMRLASYGFSAHGFTWRLPLPLLNPPRQTVTARVSPLGKLIKEPA